MDDKIFTLKDNFSSQATVYSKFRPDYPDEMIDYIVSFVRQKKLALDVATGNGQVANKLALHFEKVYATDISSKQLENAVQKDNIIYSKVPAENSGFPDKHFDIVVVAQAIHWFDFEQFYHEVNRILKTEGIFAVVGYGLFSTNPDSDKIINKLYVDILGSYWDPERRYLDENYETIPFPFDEIYVKKFHNIMTWSFEQVEGYLESWSATQHYKDQHDKNPRDAIRADLRESWKNGNKKVCFPLLLRIGKPHNK